MVRLTEQTEKLLEEKVKSGGYGSADEVVRAALAALDGIAAGEMTGQVLDAIDRSEDQIERGDVHDWKDVRDNVRNAFRGH